jgi:hypothetical protein
MKLNRYLYLLWALLAIVSLGCHVPFFSSLFGASTGSEIVIAPETRVWPQKPFAENGKDNAVYFNGFKRIIFSQDINDAGQISQSGDMFPKGTSKVWVTFFYSRLKQGDSWGWKWTQDGVSVLEEMDKKWDFDEGSGDVAFQISANPELSGEYLLTLYYKGKEAASGGFYISKTKNLSMSENDLATVKPEILETKAQPTLQSKPKPEPTPTTNSTPTTNPNMPLQLPAEMGGGDEANKPTLILSMQYADPDNLFTVNYPKGWVLSRSDEWQEICMDRDKFVCFSAQINEYPKDGLLSTFVNDTYEIFKRAVGDYELIKREEILLNGYPAVMLENGYHTKDAYNQGFAVYLLNNQKRISYQIHAVIKENMEDYDLYYFTLKQMIYSFQPAY